MKILYLTLKKDAFDVMVTGEKKSEYRRKSKWIRSRLIDANGKPKQYEFVKFVNGYGKNKPYFIVEYKGFTNSLMHAGKHIYSNGLKVDVGYDDYVIFLGDVMGIKLKKDISF